MSFHRKKEGCKEGRDWENESEKQGEREEERDGGKIKEKIKIKTKSREGHIVQSPLLETSSWQSGSLWLKLYMNLTFIIG